MVYALFINWLLCWMLDCLTLLFKLKQQGLALCCYLYWLCELRTWNTVYPHLQNCFTVSTQFSWKLLLNKSVSSMFQFTSTVELHNDLQVEITQEPMEGGCFHVNMFVVHCSSLFPWSQAGRSLFLYFFHNTVVLLLRLWMQLLLCWHLRANTGMQRVFAD